MITVKSDRPILGISFAEILDYDIIQNLREGFGMMGMRFTGKPNKAGIVKAYDEYVKGNPVEVLRCLRSEDLKLVDKILKQGKGAHVTVKGTQIYNQLQKMNLVANDAEAVEYAAKMGYESETYPVVYFGSDTTGEKAYEEFYVPGEKIDMQRFRALGVVEQSTRHEMAEVNGFFDKLEGIFAKEDFTKAQVVDAIKEFIPNFEHEEKGKNLDQKM